MDLAIEDSDSRLISNGLSPAHAGFCIFITIFIPALTHWALCCRRLKTA